MGASLRFNSSSIAVMCATLCIVMCASGCNCCTTTSAAQAHKAQGWQPGAKSPEAYEVSQSVGPPTDASGDQNETTEIADLNSDLEVAAQDKPPQPPIAKPRILSPAEGIEVEPDRHEVRLTGIACLDEGWLEQIACAPMTREYESLIVLEQSPSLIHAAMLMAGFEPGTPGTFYWVDKKVQFQPPTGSNVELLVRYDNANGETIEMPVRSWIRDHLGRQDFPDKPWTFGGSMFRPNNERLRELTGADEHYLADMTGSIIGLVTFGDEVIGFSEVMSHDTEVQPAEWEVDSDRVPEPGTPVTLIIRPYERDEASDAHGQSSQHRRDDQTQADDASARQ